MADVYHAVGLNMHQPLGNLSSILNSNESWEAKQIMSAYDRIPKIVKGYEDIAKLHMIFSGTLLKQFEDTDLHAAFADIVNIPEMLQNYRNSNLEMIGTGLFHPVFPLIPKADWEAHLEGWQGLGRHLLGWEEFQGFWPPEMGFCMEMIPALKKYGYRYVVVDCWYINPKREMKWEEKRYRPYVASYEGESIIVIPRDRELSDAQESGLDLAWFQHEVSERTKWCDFPALVTTFTDGENGGWFRTMEKDSSFWGGFYLPMLDAHRNGTLGFDPIYIREYLDLFPPTEEVEVHRGSWNTGDHWGGDFTQWTGSLLQKRGFDELKKASAYYQHAKREFDFHRESLKDPEDLRQVLYDAYDHLLKAETSCNFYWGSRWVHHSFDDIEQVYFNLDKAMEAIDHAKPKAKETVILKKVDPTSQTVKKPSFPTSPIRTKTQSNKKNKRNSASKRK